MFSMLNFIGCGSAFSQETNSCAYIIHRRKLLLLDCGENTFSKVKRLLDDNRINEVNVCITHTHADHVNGLSTLIFYLHFIKKIHIHIYVGSRKTMDSVNQLLSINGNHTDQYRIYTTETDFIQIEEDLMVSFIKTKHVDEMDCFGLLIRYCDKNIYYSGDSLVIPNVVYNMIKNNKIDVLYQDVGSHYESRVHMSLEDLKTYDFSNYNGKIFIYHNLEGELAEWRF